MEQIRTCTREDLRALEWDGLFTHHREIIERTYAAQEQGQQLMLVGVSGGPPMAQVWIDFDEEAASGAAIFWAFRVHPSARGRGLGTRLLAAAEEAARRRGCQRAVLFADPANERAARLYARCGYLPTGRVTRGYSYTTPDGRVCHHLDELVRLEKQLEPPLVIRWTIGDVHPSGFEALRLSIWGAFRLFAEQASYVVCVNSLDVLEAENRAGDLPRGVHWRAVTIDDLGPVLTPHLDDGLAEGAGWKLAPPALDDRPELALDNDCILWELPAAICRWKETGGSSPPVLAEDVRACFGKFHAMCRGAPRNAGIRARPRAFDLEWRIRDVLRRSPARLSSELDEQGLQVAALSIDGEPEVVTLDEVTVCSPFPPHLPHLGRCGVHLVGLNARSLPWSHEGRGAVEWLQEHWRRLRGEIARRVGV